MQTKHTMNSSDFVRPFAATKRKSYDGPILVTQNNAPIGVFVCMNDWHELTKIARKYEKLTRKAKDEK
ncbi:hypothetical protein [Vibrio phage LP.2]|nr:hypothetical protein [Vibrio phage LP.2]